MFSYELQIVLVFYKQSVHELSGFESQQNEFTFSSLIIIS